jgi:membrane fusion protein, multidrug efflux system
MNKRIIGIVAVVIALGGGLVLVKQRQGANANAASAAAQPAQKPIEVLASDLAVAGKAPLARVLPVTGTVKATQQATIRSKVSGDVARVLVREGEAVAAGAVLAQIDTTEFASRVAEREQNLNAARAQLAIAQRNAENNKRLVAQGFISPSAMDTTQNQLEAQRAAVAAAEQQLTQARKTLADATVRAPFAGVVTERTVQAGDKASPDMKLFALVDNRSLEYEAALDPEDAAQVKPGMVITLTPDGLPAVTAKVLRVNAAVTSGSRAVMVYAAVPSDAGLKSGQFAGGNLRLGGVSDAVLVPAEALREEGGRTVVYTLVKQGDSSQLQAVAVRGSLRGEAASGANAGQVMVAVDGLPEGTQIVARNLGPLRMGVPVKIAQATAPAAPSGPAAAPTPAKPAGASGKSE